MSPEVLLDTDMVSLYMRRRPSVVRRIESYLEEHKRITLSAMTRFEIMRGLKARSSTRGLRAFNMFCGANIVLLITDEIIVTAADIYADLYRRGELIGDADILIAATALVHDLVVVTNNLRHFDRVTGLKTENWHETTG